ncbi:MAG: hypothetical protein EPO22_09605 [Dehalococcoidia bacterium]|nr:MAG: hypothetical protein EPO22_09605 [Dehalococcoidia bacterium]
MRKFELPVAVTLRLQSRSGRVDVIAEPREDVLAEGDDIQAQSDDGGATLRIRNGRGSRPFEVRCPVGTDVMIGTQSGNVRMTGDFGTVSVTTASGSIELESADEADLRTMSSSITVGSCRGKCRMNSASGKLQAGHVGAASAGSMSGSIEIERVEGPLKARSVSGSIRAACGGEGAIAVKTVSGKVQLSLPPGTAPRTHFKSLSGRICCDCPEGSDVLVEAMSVSGSIDIVPA